VCVEDGKELNYCTNSLNQIIRYRPR